MFDSHELIHQDLAEEVSWGLTALYEIWKEEGKIDPFLIVWPSETLLINGEEVEDGVAFDVPNEGRDAFIIAAVEKTKAWALMLCEQRDQAVVVIFESPLGAKSWVIPIVQIGGTRSLGDPDVRENTDYVGAVFKPKTLH